MTTLYKKPMDIPEEQARWLELRGWVYQLLMDFLSRPPRMSLIAQWRNRVERKSPVIPMSRGGKRLKEYLGQIREEELRSVFADEAEEYRRLFVGHQAVMTARESLFRAKVEGVSAFSCLAEIREFYLENSVVFNKLSGESDDHIALELEFMAVLSEEMLDRSSLPGHDRDLIRVQISFLESHLMRWAPRFAAELAEATESPLYTGLAELLVEFLEMDLEQLHLWRSRLE
ncbi:dehydrogenase [Paenibacillus faecis]|uniref:TorD/DmsD family molecular chaperone n=1 Tax=Paenibacillus TaxID=44249 RepID=UPI001B2EC38D|nr:MULTISPECIES: molecular chaperone TorD family protein [Paenibacillus]MCA1294071.1 molecular chaperone TorD family protein [Paenibacillus sp. alder61]GIO86488.1 dehydrogenase [Paenibacillus faecis]